MIPARSHVLASLLITLALPACFIVHRSAGRELPADLAASLESGRSTKGEVLAILGAPESIRRQFDGDLFLYARSLGNSRTLSLIPWIVIYQRTRGESWTDRLAVLFDHDGLLVSIGLQREIPAEP